MFTGLSWHEGVQIVRLGEAANRLFRERKRAIDADFEDATGAHHQLHLRVLMFG